MTEMVSFRIFQAFNFRGKQKKYYLHFVLFSNLKESLKNQESQRNKKMEDRKSAVCGNHSIWNLFAWLFEDEKPILLDSWNRKTEYERGRITERGMKMDYSFKRGTKSEKGWSCGGKPLETEFGAIMGMKLATTARRKKEKGRVRILLYPY
ncbi:hypothetical protein LOAG_02345 [Loa loa]|uniref:Uncharacterized protein n=1 Tax=Loa loa TaxID=7209 RepID=A0A1S0U8V4_LOALO|nr:hypothetical protein LOAG_02345 [Loa loa]EFO26141.1 hypothetical protein LOAG_02345 [Loa loa]